MITYHIYIYIKYYDSIVLMVFYCHLDGSNEDLTSLLENRSHLPRWHPCLRRCKSNYWESCMAVKTCDLHPFNPVHQQDKFLISIQPIWKPLYPVYAVWVGQWILGTEGIRHNENTGICCWCRLRKLYSEVVRIDQERAGRITGMMLEFLGEDSLYDIRIKEDHWLPII